MTKIQVPGTGCAKCSRLAENAEEAARAAGITYELVKVTDLNDILRFGVMITPALVVNGVVKCVGKVPPAVEIRKMLT